MSEADCLSVLDAFAADSGIETNFVRLGAGEIVARIRAEKGNPQASLWLAGAADNFIQASGEGLLEAHESNGLTQVRENHTDPQRYWTPISLSPIAFAYNEDYLKDLGVAQSPSSWRSFADPVFNQAVALAHPAASGTAYVALASMVQIFGEDETFKLLREIDANVVQYTRSGSAPSRMTASGEVGLAMAYTQDIEVALDQGYKLGYSFPKEGTGFEVNAAALIANAPEGQKEGARQFLDWILTEKGQQAMVATFRGSIIPGYKNPKAHIDVSTVKLIDYDPQWAGTNRARLLERFESEVRHATDAK